MSHIKPVKTFIILFLTILIAMIVAYKSCAVQNEESVYIPTPTPVEILEQPSAKSPKFPMVPQKPIVSEAPNTEVVLLTQQEEIELHIQNAVSLYPNLSSNLISAVIWRESRYNPNAKNYNGTCVGLMQLSTKWHTKRAQSLGVTNLYDPYGNILTGCDLLSELLESYNLEMALMVYHGGYSYAQQYQAAGTTDQYTKDILSYANQIKEVT